MEVFVEGIRTFQSTIQTHILHLEQRSKALVKGLPQVCRASFLHKVGQGMFVTKRRHLDVCKNLDTTAGFRYKMGERDKVGHQYDWEKRCNGTPVEKETEAHQDTSKGGRGRHIQTLAKKEKKARQNFNRGEEESVVGHEEGERVRHNETLAGREGGMVGHQ